MTRVVQLAKLLFLIYTTVNCDDVCSVIGTMMNCNNKGLTDCPIVRNRNITTLNLNNNKISSLNSANCRNWTQLRTLHVSENQLTTFLDFDVFDLLNYVNASGNQLTNVIISHDQIVTLDLSRNKITAVDLKIVSMLQTLFFGHNSLTEDVVNKMLIPRYLPLIVTLDFSYNDIKHIPIEFMSFTPSSFSSLNLAGNKLSDISYQLFSSTNKKFTLDLSHNLLNKVGLNIPTNIINLDLSHNLISIIDNVSLSFLVVMNSVDISDNPLNCSCTFRPPFVEAINHHKDLFRNQQSTNCMGNNGPNIFNPQCSSISALSPWRWLAPLIVIVLVVVVVTVYVIQLRRRRSGYKEIGETLPPWMCNPSSWIALDCLRARNVHVDAPINNERSFCDQSLDFEDKLIILCSTRTTRWVSREIVPHLGCEPQIINSKVRQLPYSSFVLVVVDGDADIGDGSLIRNVTVVRKGQVDMRLLLRSMPGSDNLRKNNGLTKYINEQMSSTSHVLFDAEYPLTCIDTLKNWMNFYP